MKIYESAPIVFDMTHCDDVIREVEGPVPTLQARMGTGGNQVPLVLSDPNDRTIGTLTSSDLVKRANNQSINNGLYVLSENGTDRAIEKDMAPPVKTTTVPTVFDPYNNAESDVSFTLRAGISQPTNTPMTVVKEDTDVVSISGNIIGREPGNGGHQLGIGEDGKSFTLTSTDRHAVAVRSSVRRLMPIECERLQGFPDNWTRIPYRGKPAEQCPDSPRYKAIGNSWAVPVIAWIGKRIDNALEEKRSAKSNGNR